MQTEALVTSTPLVHYINENKYNLAELYSFIQARDAFEIADSFANYLANPKKYQKMSEEANKWLQEEMYQAIYKICDLIEEVKK